VFSVVNLHRLSAIGYSRSELSGIVSMVRHRFMENELGDKSEKEFEVSVPFTGGCVCRAVRYEITAQPLMMLRCHCRDCQHVTGGPYAPAILVPIEAFKVTKGAVRYHFTESLAGGKHKRGFCPECGSRLTGGEAEHDSKMVGVVAGSLDDPSWFRPAMDIFVADAQPWERGGVGLPQYEAYPAPQ
jgi:hypothetical protein